MYYLLVFLLSFPSALTVCMEMTEIRPKKHLFEATDVLIEDTFVN